MFGGDAFDNIFGELQIFTTLLMGAMDPTLASKSPEEQAKAFEESQKKMKVYQELVLPKSHLLQRNMRCRHFGRPVAMRMWRCQSSGKGFFMIAIKRTQDATEAKIGKLSESLLQRIEQYMVGDVRGMVMCCNVARMRGEKVKRSLACWPILALGCIFKHTPLLSGQ